MRRKIEPELLDTLPEGHPDALKNRRDLLLLNRLMRSFHWFNRCLRRRLRPGDHVLEIGGGVGELGRFLARRTLRGFKGRVAGLDLWARPASWPADWEWVRGDLLAYKGYGSYNVILANMILHQFSDRQLLEWARLALPHVRLLMVNEPARRKSTFIQFRAACLLGLNYVSRHDGRISIKAGFRDDELPRLLGLDHEQWKITLETSFLGGYRMVAERRDP